MDYRPGNKQNGDPIYRFELRGRIATAGFRTLHDFGKAIGVGSPKISRIICGWELPSPKVRAVMAEKLNLSIDEFVSLL